MDLFPSFMDLSKPNDLLKVKQIITELAADLDVLYTTTAPNGNISARQGRIALYNNAGTYTKWVNVDGLLTWQQIADDTGVVHTTGDESVGGVKTFTSIPVLPASDPTTDNQATRKAYVDGKFNTSTGHDHDGSDSKKVLYTNLDLTGITNGHYLYNNGGTPAGTALGSTIFSWHGNDIQKDR